MKNNQNNKHKHVLFIYSTQGVSKISLAVIYGLISIIKIVVRPLFNLGHHNGLTSRARALNLSGVFIAVLNSALQLLVGSTSRARALSRLSAAKVQNINQLNSGLVNKGLQAGLTSRARLSNQLGAFIKLGLRTSSTSRARLSSLFGVLILTATILVTVLTAGSNQASAATSNTLNFQGRLLTSTGGLVPDGTYNMEFNLYYVSTGGATQWTEDRLNTNTQGVVVKNGYFSVYLGEYDNIPALNWSEDLYLGMTIRGTGSCAWGSCTPADSEMTPRFKLTAVPYAFRAANVASSNTNAGSTNSDAVSITTGNALGATSNSGNITIDAGTATGTAGTIGIGTANASALTIGRAGITTTLQGSAAFTGAGTALTVTNNAVFNGDITLGNASADTLTVNANANFTGNLSVTTGDTFTNAGSSVYTALAISDVAGGGNIGTAAATVDGATTFNINQTTASQALTLPAPTVATAGRIVYVNNVGSVSFTMYGTTIGVNGSNAFIWNGTQWITTVSLSGSSVSVVGTIDSQTKSADGAVIVGNAIYLQTADATNVGLVSTSAQTLNGIKTFDDGIVVTSGGATISAGGLTVTGVVTASLTDNLADALDIQEGTNNYININTTNTTENISFGNATTNPSFNFLGSGTLSVAGPTTVSGLLTGTLGATISGATINLNASSNFATNINTGTSTGAVSIGNSAAGAIALQSASTIGLTGTTNINTSGTASTSIGNATGTITIAGNTLAGSGDAYDIGTAGSINRFRNIYAGGRFSSGSSGSGLNLYTETTQPIKLFVNSSEVARFTTANNFGVGVINPSGRVTVGGNASLAAWGTAGVNLQAAAATYTDTSTVASGIATDAVVNSFAAPTLAATNTSVTTTNAATVYIGGAPIAGTNQTITNSYALQVASGATQLGGTLAVTGITTFSGKVGIFDATPTGAALSVNNLGLVGSADINAFDIGAGRIGAGASIYSYGTICSSNASSSCTGNGGVVLSNAGGANTNATVNIVEDGANPMTFQGATQDGFYTIIAVTDPTAIRTITLPDASGTVLLSTTGYLQGGNSFATTATLGTNDNNNLVLRTNSITALTIDTSQAATFAGTLAVTTLGTADTSTYLCRNSSNIISGCVVSPVSSALADNVTDAFDLQEGTNNYFNINTTNGSEEIQFGNITTSPDFTFLGGGAFTVNNANPILLNTTNTLTISSTGNNLFLAGNRVLNDVADNTADAFEVREGGPSGRNYININTTDASENISFGNATTNPSYNFLGSGTLAVAGGLNVSGRVTLSSSLTVQAQTSSVLTGSIDPSGSTVVTGVGTLFTSELSVGDNILVSGETRTVISISSDTSLVVDYAFSDNANDTSPDKVPATVLLRDSGGTNTSFVNPDVDRTSRIGGLQVQRNGSSTQLQLISGGDLYRTIASVNTSNALLIGTTGMASVTIGGSGITTTNNGALTVTQLTTLNGGLTVEAGDTFTFNGDAFTDFTGGGLVNTGGVLTVDTTSATGFFQNGGNSFAGTATLGTNDANTLNFETNNATRISINSSGLISLGASTAATARVDIVDGGMSGNPTITGTALRVRSNSTTDTGTIASGTNAGVSAVGIQQLTLIASNTNVTTTNAQNLYIQGAPIAGTNQTLTNTYGLNIVTASVAGAGTATNAYGLAVAAPTGATNNYSAIFTGGNVGIGTTSPLSILDVRENKNGVSSLNITNNDAVGGSAASQIYVGENYANDQGVYLRYGNTSNGVNGANTAVLFSGGNATGGLQVGTLGTNPLALRTNNLTRLVVEGDGDVAFDTNTLFVDATNNRVGIGTAAPGSALQINGGVGTLSTGITFGDGDTGIFESVDDYINFSTAGTSYIVIGGGQLYGTTGSRKPSLLFSADSSATVPAYRFNGDTDTGIGSSAADTLNFITGGTTKLSIDSAGLSTFDGNLRISDGSSNYGTIAVQSTAGDYTYTIPTTTANDTFCLVTLANCTGGGASFIQNGNSFTANAVLGTNDAFSLILETANTTALTIDTSQNATFAGNLVVSATKSLTLTGGNTASRPGSPTEGMVYFDTTTDSLLTYANGKWQSDRGEFVVVAANDSTQAEKDSADYVADGTADQTEINSALTEAAGGKVILLAGTYVANATILIPNNTTLAGTGPGTVIELADIDATDNLIENSDTTTGTGVVIRDLKIDGRDDLNTAGTQYGIQFTGMGSGSGPSARQGGVITNVTVGEFRNRGISIVGSANNNISDNSVIGIGSVAILLNTSSNNIVSGNIAQGSLYGIFIDATSNYNTINANNVQGNSLWGITLATNSNYNAVTNNQVYDNGGATTNNGIYIDNADFNNIIGNNITDTACTTTCYAINIVNANAGRTYLEGNRFTGSATDAATINDAGTNTIYVGQQTNSATSTNNDVSDFRFRGSANSTTAFTVQNASGTSVLNVNTTTAGVTVGGTLTVDTTSTFTGLATFNGGLTVETGDTFTFNADAFTDFTGGGLVNTAGVLTVDATSATGFFRNGGNAFTAASTLGNTGNYDLNIMTNNLTRLTVEADGDVVLAAGKSLTVVGGNTASRPGSPTEGMVYFDTDTDRLMTYSNGKWQTDNRESILVAANNSSQADKDAADYVANGNTGAAADGDQIEINNALTAGSGKKVVLLAGTYVADATILIPNNTTLAGVGPGTVIELADIDATDNLIENSDTTTGTGVVIRDLKLDGRKDLNTVGTQNGIYLNAMGDGTGSSARQGALIQNIIAERFKTDSLNINNSDNTIITGNTLRSNTSSGVAAFASTNMKITNNIIQGNGDFVGNSYGVYLSAITNSNISQNTVEENFTAGIGLNTNSENNIVSENSIQNNGGTTTNYGIRILVGSYNSIIDNIITDNSCTTSCNAIRIDNSVSNKNNYLEGNRLIGSAANGANISDLGVGTIYVGQQTNTTTSNNGYVSDFRFRGSNDSTTAFAVQNAAGASILNVDSTNAEVEVGNTTTAGRLVISDGSSNTGTILVASTAGDYTFTIPTVTANDTFCLATLNNCNNNNAFIQNGNSFTATAVLGTNDNYDLQFETFGTTKLTISATGDLTIAEGASRTLTVQTRTTNLAGNNLTIQAGTAGAGGSAFVGGVLTLQGGAAGGTGNANGGNVVLTGGTGTGTGVLGLVTLAPTVFQAATVQNFTGSANITQSNIDTYSTVLISSNAAGYTATLTDPTTSTIGRVIYVTNTGSFDMALSANTVGVALSVTLKPASTATMIWNGVDWTAAGASSSTDLQAAYNNTATSAGGAELVLNAFGGAADGLTVRNNATTPIIGGLLEVQSSIGSNLFSVNNNATEYATNGGAETLGASASTFPANTWDTTTGGTVDRYTTVGDNLATGAASTRVQTTAINHGARNRLSTSLTSGLTYTVSFAVRGATNFATLEALYSPDGTTSGTTTCATTQTVTAGAWTRITCSFIASGTITSSNSILIRQTDATARTFYLDNLSVNVNASATFAADGSVDVALGTNWTNFGTLDALTRDTTIIYDTSGSVAIDTPNATDRGVRNNLAITPAVNTQYLVTFYARSSNAFSDIRVRYSRDGGTNFVSCIDYNTQTVSTSSFTKITCLFTTDGTTATDADIIIDQPTGSDRVFYIDALTVTINTNNSNNVQIGGGNKGGPVTLFTLDRSAGAPIAANNDAYLGSMYYDTITGRIQCYESGGWGTCGAPPDNIVNLNPEYAGSVLNGTGVGTMQADVCANQSGVLLVNSTLCATGEARNFYQWKSPQATQQTYSIYITYQLPSTFDGFSSDDTVQLTGRVDSTTNAAVTYEMFKSQSGTLTKCGTGETTVATTANTWQTVGINGNESTGCSFNSSSANGFVLFKINLKANSNANAYVSTLTFTTTGR